MNYRISAVEYYLPNRVIDNQYLCKISGIDMNFLVNKVGIMHRHVADTDESTSDMAVKAAEKVILKNNIDRKSIDIIVICTQNPDYKLPTTACIVQNKLGLKTTCIAFDLNLGCSGFVYTLAVVGNFIKVGMSKLALIIMVDQYSKIIDYSDKNTASLFGDAASAAIIESCPDDQGVIDTSFGTDGSNFDKLIVYNSGTVKDVDKNNYLYMDGREIFKFSITIAPNSIRDILSKNRLCINDIQLFILHQANKYMLSEIQKELQQ
ncbi:MAG: 3-oxoacyl-ACP synthase III family protein, partial [Candidatus Odinarchaeota archaeon]